MACVTVKKLEKLYKIILIRHICKFDAPLVDISNDYKNKLMFYHLKTRRCVS